MGERVRSWRDSVGWTAFGFGTALGLVIGLRLDQAALAVVAGLACGVGASVPGGVLVLLLWRRRERAPETRGVQGYGQPARWEPPLVVLAPPTARVLPQGQSPLEAYDGTMPAGREFSLIGEEGYSDGSIDW
jgi:hypothetical protein